MSCGVKVLGSMLVLRRVAATYIPADQTQSQMDPAVTHFYAFFTNVSMSAFYFYLIQVRAIFGHIISSPRHCGPTSRDPLQTHTFSVRSLKFPGAARRNGAHRRNLKNTHASAKNTCPGLKPRSNHSLGALAPYTSRT